LNIRPKNGTAAGEIVEVEAGQAVYVPSINRTIKAVSFSPFGMRNPATGEVQLLAAITTSISIDGGA
jgi:hypothetical protein